MTRVLNLLRLISLVLAMCHIPLVWAASHQASTPQVQAALVSSVSKVAPGEEITLGVHLKIIPHWHMYWQNPGDSGTVTTVDWQFSQPSEVGEILWPIPHRFKMGPIVNYGYEDEVTLPVKVKVAANLKSGETFKTTAIVDWLVCKEECIPQQVTLALSMPVVVGLPTVAPASGAPSHQPQLHQALLQQPQAAPWPVSLQATKTGLSLHVAASDLTSEAIQDVWFYPYQWGKIAQSADQTKTITKAGIQLAFQLGDAPLKPTETLDGVLVVQEKQRSALVARGYQISTPLIAYASATSAASQYTTAQADASSLGFTTALLLALLGGVVLNLMPCVFPVLSIKALSLVSHEHYSQRQILAQGVVYTLGVLASFALLAGLLIALKAGGAEIGWGFQYQSPLFVIAVAYLMFAVGLSLSGVFSIGGSTAGVGSALADKPGYAGSFFTGVLATVVATPCTAPFMAAALGYALTQSSAKLMLVFLSLGLGLALPYLLLTAWPALHRKLPKPGVWMERTKQIFAFPMYLAAVWLVWVLAQQVGANGVAVALGGMVLIAFAAWLYNTTRLISLKNQIAANVGIALVLVTTLVVSYAYLGDATPEAASQSVKASPTQYWEPYTPEKLAILLAEGKPVFLNFTAAWCISCLVNERVALSQPEVTNAFQQKGITYLKGDWTNQDAHITNLLSKFGRSGVPLYVFYPAGNNAKPIELPQILTPSIVLSNIRSSH
ncbi:thiol:disulfide interchange protein [Methylophilaceae bacterium 11]|nr:thiol:disulfide interchange protein [Methylophilaceae bacterium 11]